VNAEGLGASPPRSTDAETTRVLLASGADVKAVDRYGRTWLHFMCSDAGHRRAAPEAIETARLLLEAGADVNAKDRMRQTALHSLLSSWRMARRVPRPDGVALAKLLIDHGVDIDAVDGFGRKAQGLIINDPFQVDVRKHIEKKRAGE